MMKKSYPKTRSKIVLLHRLIREITPHLTVANILPLWSVFICLAPAFCVAVPAAPVAKCCKRSCGFARLLLPRL